VELQQEQLDLLLRLQIPVAIRATGENKENVSKWAAEFTREKLPFVIVTDGKSSFQKGEIFLSTEDFDTINVSENLESQRKHLSGREFLLAIANSDSLPAIETWVKLWEQTGKMPNFIKVSLANTNECMGLISALNAYQKIFGVIRNGNQLLSDVSWKDLPDRKTNGFFCFPVSWSGSSALAPYKAGYQFSPDIVLPSPENLKNPKVFNAVKLDAGFGLTDRYTFSKKIRNMIRGNDTEIIPYNIGFVRDKDRGQCAFFSGKAYLDGGLKSRSALRPNFSITAWIKPTELGNNNCILAKGKDFVLKIHRGQLTFTVQGVKDYYSVKTPIPVNQWSFIGLVHTHSENCVSFYLNGKLTEKINLLKPYVESDYTMLIGSNLWEEYFVGYMDEIKIWDRELNEDEIKNEYFTEDQEIQAFSFIWFIGLLVGLSLFYPIIRLWRKRKIKEVQPAQNEHLASEAQLPVTGEIGNSEQISCFGGLRVVGADQKDVSKKFSPKIKQLFVLILLHSIGGQKGISSKELSDCLWPGMSPQNAKNIRGTNIQNLKALLTSCSGIRLVFQDKLWLLEFGDGYFVDYEFVENWLNNADRNNVAQLSERLPHLLAILKKGTLFPNMDESWVDPYVNRMSNRIIEYGLQLFNVLPEGKYDALLIEVAEVISINDPLNEPALRKKVSILTRQGKLSLAHLMFDNFGKLYFELYKEKYQGDFKALVAGEVVE
jgi:DNA-binding SARP family transcriptional activator